MIEFTLLDHLPLWAFFLASLGIALVAGECGYRLGRHRKGKSGAKKEEAVGAVVGATLGLLAFLLAFTFGLAASRYDTRREVLQEEVNAIGTTYLRASFLPDPHGSKVRALLREYVDVRLEANKPGASLAEAIRKSEKIQNELWKHAAAVGRDLDKPGAPNSDMMALFVDSLNQTIDAHAKRLGAVSRARVPSAMWAGLFVIAMIAIVSMGYDVGIMGTPRPIVGLGMILCFAVTMWLIADLDRPLEGFIRVNYQGMIDLRASVNDETP
ncbi:MAG: hypothetical protein ACREYC_18955 [Gammaproteobacteria bacterium]